MNVLKLAAEIASRTASRPNLRIKPTPNNAIQTARNIVKQEECMNSKIKGTATGARHLAIKQLKESGGETWFKSKEDKPKNDNYFYEYDFCGECWVIFKKSSDDKPAPYVADVYFNNELSVKKLVSFLNSVDFISEDSTTVEEQREKNTNT